MFIDDVPACCTSAIIYSFGEHGEESEVTVEKIKELIATKTTPQYRIFNNRRELAETPKLNIIAFSVDPKNIAILLEAGFKDVDSYDGVQGKVHLLTFHA